MQPSAKATTATSVAADGVLLEVVPIARAGAIIEKLTGGVRPHRATLERWLRRGVRGQRLETFTVGARRFVRVDEIRRFLAATQAVDSASAA